MLLRKVPLQLTSCMLVAVVCAAAQAQPPRADSGAATPAELHQAEEHAEPIERAMRRELEDLRQQVEQQSQRIDQLLKQRQAADDLPDEIPSPQPLRPIFYQIEERPELDVPLLVTPSPPAEVPGQRFAIGYDGGFFIRPTEEHEKEIPFALKINGRTQFRLIAFDDMGDSPFGNEFDFELERNRLVFSGYAFDPKLTYVIQLDGDSDDENFVEFIDYFIIYEFREEFAVRAGLWKLPFTKQDTVSSARLQFVDRSIADEVFNIDRSQGVSILGTLCEELFYEAAMVNGFNTDNRVPNRLGDLDTNPAFTGRAYWEPWGKFGSHESDLEYHECPAVRIGGSLAYSEVDPPGRAELREFKLIDSGRPVADVIPGAMDGFTALLGAADLSYKYRGFSASTEWFVRHLFHFETAEVGEVNAYGFYIQGGYFLIPKQFEIAARWSRVWGDQFPGHPEKSADEIGGAINYYIKGDDLKLSFSAIHLNGAPLFSDTTAIQPGDDGMQYMGQLQFAF